ncbi:MAG: uracil-DNA glycosylase [Pseudomonadota bacterium]|nr:uracil-DNA glycosylase [Pseudomonadota bacterium]
MVERGREELLLLIGALRSHLEAEGAAGNFTISSGGGGGGVTPREGTPLPAAAERPPAASPPGVRGSTAPPPAPRTIPAEQAAPGEAERTPPLTASPAVAPDLEGLRAELGNCRRCRLHLGRRNLVFGEGSPRATLVFVGEAPGADEDAQGRPFVGRAGQLLTRIIEAMNMKRSEVYICNILKCRPPGNRNPDSVEIAACEPFLVRQLQAIRPRAICALGTIAAQTLLKTGAPISTLRGRWHSYHDIPLMPTYHPAYLLRNPAQKRQVWEDVQKIMTLLNDGDGYESGG